jgi:HEAT repeats
MDNEFRVFRIPLHMQRKYFSVHIEGQQTPTIIEETLRKMRVQQCSLGDFRSLIGLEDHRVRFYAARVVAIFSNIPHEAVREIFGNPDGLVETIDLTNVESIIRHLGKESPPAYRKALVNVLGFHGTSHAEHVAPVLGGLIGRGCDPDTREAAFLALQEMGGNASSATEVVPALVDLIANVTEPKIRAQAIRAI